MEIWLDGADEPAMPTTPAFRKSLPLSKAMANETIVATTMNGIMDQMEAILAKKSGTKPTKGKK